MQADVSIPTGVLLRPVGGLRVDSVMTGHHAPGHQDETRIVGHSEERALFPFACGKRSISPERLDGPLSRITSSSQGAWSLRQQCRALPWLLSVPAGTKQYFPEWRGRTMKTFCSEIRNGEIPVLKADYLLPTRTTAWLTDVLRLAVLPEVLSGPIAA